MDKFNEEILFYSWGVPTALTDATLFTPWMEMNKGVGAGFIFVFGAAAALSTAALSIEAADDISGTNPVEVELLDAQAVADVQNNVVVYGLTMGDLPQGKTFVSAKLVVTGGPTLATVLAVANDLAHRPSGQDNFVPISNPS